MSLKPHCDSGVDLRSKDLQAIQGDLSEDFANDAQPCSSTGWLCWHFSCLRGCDLAPSTGRGAHEAVAGWFASHASKLQARYRPSMVPCHRRDCRWLC